MIDRFDDMEREKAAIPKPSPRVTIGNVSTEVPLSAAGLPVAGPKADIDGVPGFDYDVLTQAPFRRNDKIDPEKEAKVEQKRPMWSSRIDFVIALMSIVWTVDNIQFFARRMINHGGGAFLFPYVIFCIAFAYPTIIIELLIGQVFRRGVIVNMERVHKIFSGVGKSMFIIAFVKNIYYNTVSAWSLYYVIKEIWSIADISTAWSLESGICERNGWTGVELACCRKSYPIFHWFYEFLNVSSGPFSGLDFTWYSYWERYWPFIVIAAAWVLLGALLCCGLSITGKLFYIMLGIPILVFTFLFAKAFSTWDLNPENADEPIAKLFQLFVARWDALTEAQTWIEALVQALRGYLIGTGVFSTFSGYASRRDYIITDGTLVFIWGLLVPIVTCFLLIPIASYYPAVPSLQYLQSLPLDNNIFFVIIPTVIQSIEETVTGKTFAYVAVALYFIAMFLLTYSSAVAVGEIVIAALMDIEFPNKIVPFKLKYKRTTLTIVYSVVSCVIALVFGLQNGQYLFLIVDEIMYPIPALFLACAEVFAVVWIYSIYRFNDDVWLKSGYQIPVLMQQYVTWILSPGLLCGFAAAVYIQVDHSFLNAVTETVEYVLTTSVIDDTLQSTASNTSQIVTMVNYGYPALVDCETSPIFQEYREWPSYIVIIQWIILTLFTLSPIASSLSYNAEARKKWRIYKHKRKFPLGIIYPTDNRGEWNSPLTYVLAQTGAGIGAGILSGFVYKYYTYGKYIFVIQCLIVQLLFTIPAFIIDIDLGQIFRKGPITVWKKVHPIFTGLGWCALFINLFLLTQYLYPTVGLVHYLYDYVEVQFFGTYSYLDELINGAISSEKRPGFIPQEKQHIYPWNSCIYMLCKTMNCTSLIDTGNTIEQIYSMSPGMCNYSPALFNFQTDYIFHTGDIKETSIVQRFFGDEVKFENTTQVFNEISDFIVGELSVKVIIMGGIVFLVCGAITLMKPTVRHLIHVLLVILPLVGIVAGSVYVALRGAANDDLVEFLFDLRVPRGVSTTHHIRDLLSQSESWAQAGLVAITFNFLASGVNIALSSYNPRENWANLQGIVIVVLTWLGNIIFIVFFFLNMSYLKLITNNWDKRVQYGLVDRVTFDMDAMMDVKAGASYLSFSVLADSLTFHKHTMAVLPIILICIALLCFCPLQALFETLTTTIFGAGFFSFSRIPSCILAVVLSAIFTLPYTFPSGFAFFVYQIFEQFVYSWPVPLLGALMVISCTWVFSMYRLNNTMFMYSMHHLSYYWMFVWPFITPLGLLVLSGYTGYEQYNEILGESLSYFVSLPINYSIGREEANNTDVMKMYFKEQTWSYPILYISSAVNVIYLAPFLLVFLAVGLFSCFKDFPCKPVCYEYYEDDTDTISKVVSNEQDIIQTTVGVMNDDGSFDNMSMEYSDYENETNSTSSGESTIDNNEAGQIEPTMIKDKKKRAHFEDEH